MRRLSLEEAGRFHGHLGPYLALGYLAGEMAVEELEPQSELDLFASVRLPLKRPETCFVDGVQCSTRCTLGKLNIEVIELQTGISARFLNVKTGRELEVRVRGEVLQALGSMEGRLEDAVKWLLSRPREAIFQASVRDAGGGTGPG